VKDGAIEGAEVGLFFGGLGFRMEGAEDVGHGLGGGEGFFADAFEVEIDLGVGEVGSEFGGEFEGEGGLADSALALEPGDVDAAFFDGGAEFGEFGGASGEVGGWGWELVQSCDDGKGSFVDVFITAHNIATDGGLPAADANADLS
jgi:hypothetical protein